MDGAERNVHAMRSSSNSSSNAYKDLSVQSTRNRKPLVRISVFEKPWLLLPLICCCAADMNETHACINATNADVSIMEQTNKRTQRLKRQTLCNLCFVRTIW